MFARYTNEFVDGSRVAGTFTLRSREVRSTRRGDAYLSVEIGDRTGIIPGVLFRPDPVAVAVPSGSVVHVQGTVTTFRGVKRVSIQTLRPAESWDSSELIACSPIPVEEMVAEVRTLVGSISDPGLRRLLRTIFGDKDVFSRFCACPASQHHHHAYLGGLVAHTVAVAETCDLASRRYDDIDRDLLVTAALLHDLGKIDELTTDHSITLTDEGRLLGHVVAGVVRLRDAGVKAKLAPDVLMRLEHCVLSHHGELEWGAPKKPSTIEALVLHHADNMDAKAAAFSGMLKGAMLANEAWTDAGNLFRRPLYAPKAIADERADVDDEASVRMLSA